MSLRSFALASACAGAFLCGLPAVAQTNVVSHHRIHHSRAVAHETAAEISQTRDLNRQQLATAQSGLQFARTQPMSGSQAAAEPVSRAMYQRVPGGNPLHSAAAGGGAHMSGPPPVHN